MDSNNAYLPLQAILCAPTTFDFPEFSCLLNLELRIPWFNLSLMINLLSKCPMLQVFKICNDWQIFTVRSKHPSSWTPPTSVVPDCLVSHLRKIEFQRYEGSKDEMEFITYALKNGLVLETVSVHLDWLESEKGKEKREYNILTELCGMQRGSNLCQINRMYYEKTGYMCSHVHEFHQVFVQKRLLIP
ncbi:hypothetical protein PIB30_049761 [Stylosanthes scabra]|uniref:FBD domain-containing protein n=1 Tax=Stylosanthes scabra TaxID=79078 RepID=A0ABU6XHQ8_9FABA|nr:hypothetical protein [Stylosanthes scabra]